MPSARELTCSDDHSRTAAPRRAPPARGSARRTTPRAGPHHPTRSRRPGETAHPASARAAVAPRPSARPLDRRWSGAGTSRRATDTSPLSTRAATSSCSARAASARTRSTATVCVSVEPGDSRFADEATAVRQSANAANVRSSPASGGAARSRPACRSRAYSSRRRGSAPDRRPRARSDTAPGSGPQQRRPRAVCGRRSPGDGRRGFEPAAAAAHHAASIDSTNAADGAVLIVLARRIEALHLEEPDGRIEQRRVELLNVVGVGPHPVPGRQVLRGRVGWHRLRDEGRPDLGRYQTCVWWKVMRVRFTGRPEFVAERNHRPDTAEYNRSTNLHGMGYKRRAADR